jgi:hypothetical protein
MTSLSINPTSQFSPIAKRQARARRMEIGFHCFHCFDCFKGVEQTCHGLSRDGRGLTSEATSDGCKIAFIPTD